MILGVNHPGYSPGRERIIDGPVLSSIKSEVRFYEEG